MDDWLDWWCYGCDRDFTDVERDDICCPFCGSTEVERLDDR